MAGKEFTRIFTHPVGTGMNWRRRVALHNERQQ
jgi:hypothetical protein